MNTVVHQSAENSHYDAEASSYDAMNEKNSRAINKAIYSFLKRYKVKSVIDLTCGTGSQSFFLNKKGLDVSSFDINSKMLAVARQKAKEQNLNLNFNKGDVRTTQAGQFDAAITIFNAIGHLTIDDFKLALNNISTNLRKDGVYIFDIFNLNYLLHKDNITHLTIDWQKQVGNKTVREIQYSTINEQGVLASFDTYIEVSPNKKPKVSHHQQTLQVYSSSMIRAILKASDFKVLNIVNTDLSPFKDKKSERMLVVAQKR